MTVVFANLLNMYVPSTGIPDMKILSILQNPNTIT